MLPCVRLGRSKPLPLVDPQRLRMHAGELRRHADHVDGALAPARRCDPSIHHQATPSRFRGDSFWASCSCLSNCFSSRESLSGTSTLHRDQHVAVPALLRRALAAHPERLAVRRAGGHLQRHRAVQRGDLDVRAQRRLRIGDRQLDGQVVALAAEHRHAVATRTRTYRSPGCPPAGPGSPRPASLIRAPSFTPAGIFTWNFRVRRSAPDPWQVGHGVLDDAPAAPALGARLLHREEPLVHADGARATARGTRDRGRCPARAPTAAAGVAHRRAR